MAQANPIERESASTIEAPQATRAPDPGQDWEVLHGEDRGAGTAVAVIMITIFLLAVVGYTIIALLAAAGPS